MTDTDQRPTIKCAHCSGRHTTAREVLACYNGDTQPSTPATPKLPMNEKAPSEAQIRYALDLVRTRVWPQEVTDATLRAMDRYAASRLIDALLKADVKPRDPASPEADPEVPAGRYAVADEDDVNFYQVNAPKTGKWSGYIFLARLYGAPGDYRKEPIRAPAIKRAILALLASDPEKYMKEYGRRESHCGACSSPLTDPTSRRLGMGPDCRRNRGW